MVVKPKVAPLYCYIKYTKLFASTISAGDQNNN
jgi:hypothetical protein